MNNKKTCLLVIGLLAFSSIIQLSTVHFAKASYGIGDKGVFKADLGKNQNNTSILLWGKYAVSKKTITVNGIARIGEKKGSFKGLFKGNYFVLTILSNTKALTIIGKISLNENNTFKGLWIGRGLPVKGWIRGLFIPSNQENPPIKNY